RSRLPSLQCRAMRISHYNAQEAGLVEGGRVHPIGPALIGAGHLRQGYTMQEVIERLANEPAAMRCAREAMKGRGLPLAQATLLAPIENPPSLWCAAANYKDHQAEMSAASGGPDRSDYTKDDLMAEFSLKPSSSIIGPGGTIVIPRVSNHVDYECELCVVIGKKAHKLSEDQALDCVFGYTLCWDISQRD